MIKKLSLCALSVLAALPIGMAAQAAEGDMQLQQVLMFSRHNLRAPLADNGSVLEQSTKKSWPQWSVPGGQLTTKGGVLEVYMGNYTRQWLAQQGLVQNGSCPDSSNVFVYANSLQRTVATAQFFVNGAFPGCDIAVTHQDAMGSMDPVFNPVITDDSEEFNKKALAAMTAENEKLALKPALQQLDKIVDYKSAPACNNKKQCDLSSGDNVFSAENGKEPNVSGPLKVGNSLMDAFTLQYYEGFPLEQVAWGQIKTPEQWKALSAIKNGYQDALFTSPEVAREVAAPLVDYIRSQLVDQDKANAPKITLMVGHDSNIASLLSALQVKPYELPGTWENTPIGGQLVFERWHDAKNNKDLLKLEYVYQTADQLRDGEVLSLKNPPKRVTLQLEGCPTDGNGYCSWDQFTQALNVALQGTPMEPAAQPAAANSDAAAKPAESKPAADKAAADKAAADKAVADKAAADKAAAEKAAAQKAAEQKAAEAKAAEEKAKVAEEKAKAERAAAQKAAAEKAAADKAAAEKASASVQKPVESAQKSDAKQTVMQ
ncbi:bifunctional glucose-1-phosphatase/inositol phosphatase [Candidatus Pantoea alvi]|uniref:bifunctional glucose-1-phosphatase/inositol phosphatase n=1 Tax=Enterobacter agglomerans TaxID=549 RepID=UPI000CDD1456|nr:bifunctional glucose-1-phosphatase/inositol phosphatase [Pantoea agglomerans]POW57562.1 bifunctional glucose-1-phosphatase/inositol phosphatase [Pantoea alvi]UBN53186.1 bifunctional glucose-1-phosphatase/inositol phosphatase [Pantoea agglomerans]